MKQIVLKQGSPEWLAWRNGGLGSSDAIVIAAHYGMIEQHPWMDSLDDLYQEKITGVSRTVVNDRMLRGTANEPAARAAFEARTGLVLQPLCAEMDSNPRIRASFDGITFDGNETVEIKCPNDKVHDLAKTGEIVDYYVPQVCHQSLVAWGVPSTWVDSRIINFFSYVPETEDGAAVRKPAVAFRDFATKLYEYELEFIESVRKRVPPCGVEYAEESAVYLALDAELDALKVKLAASKNRLIALAKARSVEKIAACGVTVMHSRRVGAVNWTKLSAEYSITDDEVAKYRKKDSQFWQVRTKASADDVAGEDAAEQAA